MAQPATPSLREDRTLASGMSVDCARRYLSVDTLKRLVDALSGHDGAFLQMHLTDNQNVGVECALLGQTVETAELLADGSYRNPQTELQFLSSAQVKDLVRYAANRNVEIVPEIDAPAHMEGFFVLAENMHGSAYADSLAYDRDDYPGELDISSRAAVRFVRRLYDEYAELFDGCRCFHIGCDEHFSGSAMDKATYVRGMAAYVRSKGFTVRMWNDLLTKENVGSLDKQTQVTYWSWDGDAQDPAEAEARRASRATVADLQAEGIDVLICNAYYLYYVPSGRNFNEHDNDYTVRDLQENWNIRKWHRNSGLELADTRHIIGSAVCLWNEDSAPLSEDQITTQFIRQYETMSWVNENVDKI